MITNVLDLLLSKHRLTNKVNFFLPVFELDLMYTYLISPLFIIVFMYLRFSLLSNEFRLVQALQVSTHLNEVDVKYSLEYSVS